MNFFKKKSPPVDTTQVLVALARVVHPEQRRDLKQLNCISRRRMGMRAEWFAETLEQFKEEK